MTADQDATPAATTVPPGPDEAGAEVHFDDPDLGGWRDDLIGLLRLGELTGWFDWCGHRIAIRTLTTDEELLVSQLTSEYEGGMGGMKAYATATSALCVTSVDRRPLPVPLGEEPGRPHKWALERFNYARQWYPPTIDAILSAYLQLEIRQRRVLEGLGKASPPGATAIPGSSASSG